MSVKFPKTNVPINPDTPIPGVDAKNSTLIGQMTTGTATAGVLLKDIDLNTENALFGENSMVATMVRAFRKFNPYSKLDLLPLADDGGATASAGSVTFTGTNPTETGTLVFSIGNIDRFYSIDLVIADTPTTIAAKLDAAVSADAKSLVSSAPTLGVVDFEAVNGGTVGDSIGIQVTGAVAGITVAIVAMTGGATDPSMTGLADLLVDRTDIIMPYEYGIVTFKDLLDSRFNFENVAMDGRLFTAIADTKSNLVIIGNAENSQSLIIFVDKPVDLTARKSSSIFAMTYEESSRFAGIRALRLEDGGRDLSEFLVTRKAADKISGVHTSSLPYANTAMRLDTITVGQGWTDAEVTDLKAAGLSRLGNNRANNILISDEVLTTYKTDVQGNPDLSFKFLPYVDTSTAGREFVQNSLIIDFGQTRLTNGETLPDHDMTNAGDITNKFLGYIQILGDSPYVILQSGALSDGSGATVLSKVQADLTVTIDVAEGEALITSAFPILTQLRGITAPLTIRFNPQALT